MKDNWRHTEHRQLTLGNDAPRLVTYKDGAFLPKDQKNHGNVIQRTDKHENASFPLVYGLAEDNIQGTDMRYLKLEQCISTHNPVARLSMTAIFKGGS